MTGNKKVICNVYYRVMRSDHLKRHMKQHSEKNESVPANTISVTNNIYNNNPTVPTYDLTKRSNKESMSNYEGVEKKANQVGEWVSKETYSW